MSNISDSIELIDGSSTALSISEGTANNICSFELKQDKAISKLLSVLRSRSPCEDFKTLYLLSSSLFKWSVLTFRDRLNCTQDRMLELNNSNNLLDQK